MKNAFFYIFLGRKFIWSNNLCFLLWKYGKIYRLQKSVHALKQPPQAWLERVSFVVQEYGFCHSQKAHSIFFGIHEERYVLLVVYKDDITIIGNNVHRISDLKSHLRQKLQIKDKGPL